MQPKMSPSYAITATVPLTTMLLLVLTLLHTKRKSCPDFSNIGGVHESQGEVGAGVEADDTTKNTKQKKTHVCS